MDFRYQNAARKLGTRDISSTSSSSEGSTTFVPDSKEGTYSPLPAFAEQAINQLNLAEKEHEHSQEDGDSDQNMEMDTDHEKDTEPDDVATSHEGGANPSLIGSDQKHKRPVQAMTKSWPQHSSVQPDTSGGDGADSQIFFASRVSFWAMVAAHGLPSTCGPPEGMFELGEEMGGAWSCVSNPIVLTDIVLSVHFLRLLELVVRGVCKLTETFCCCSEDACISTERSGSWPNFEAVLVAFFRLSRIRGWNSWLETRLDASDSRAVEPGIRLGGGSIGRIPEGEI